MLWKYAHRNKLTLNPLAKNTLKFLQEIKVFDLVSIRIKNRIKYGAALSHEQFSQWMVCYRFACTNPEREGRPRLIPWVGDMVAFRTESGVMELRQYFFFTPIDEERIRIQVALRINKDKIKLPMPLQYLVLKLIEKQNKKILLKNFEEDRPIWENKKFRSPPILCEGDGPIIHLRTWMKQFYTQAPQKSRTQSIEDLSSVCSAEH